MTKYLNLIMDIWIVLLLALPVKVNGTGITEVVLKASTLRGSPPSSATTAPGPIDVRYNETTPFPEIGLGFIDEFYIAKIPENATALELIRTLVLDNGTVPNRTVPVRCCIIGGNDEGLFYTKVKFDGNCEVRLRVAKLDHETTEAYQLKVKLCMLPDFVNPLKALTTLEILVIDVNDNKPEFVFPSVGFKTPNPRVYYGAISRDSKLGTQVLTVKAEDRDSGILGAVSYEIVADDKESEYFAIGNATGDIETIKLFGNLDKSRLPMAFKVLARDNYLSSCCSNTNQARVVVNLIEEDNRLIMVLEGVRMGLVQEAKSEIERILQEHTGLIVGVEKVTPKQFLQENETLQFDYSATDLWLYAVDPKTETILNIHETELQRSILDNSALYNITFGVFGNVQVNVSMIHAPYVDLETVIGVLLATSDVLPFTVTIILPCLALVLVTASIIFTCQLFKQYRPQNQRIYSRRERQNNSISVETTVKKLENDPEISCSFIWMPVFSPSSDSGVSSSSQHSTRSTTSGVSTEMAEEEMTTEL